MKNSALLIQKAPNKAIYVDSILRISFLKIFEVEDPQKISCSM
jgi:hypothetical protein